MLINFVVVVSAAVFVGFLLGIHNVLTQFEENKCEMTYMFEYPQYVKIPWPGNVEKRFPSYGLYAYGEGQRTEKLRQMRFDGIPVLFIPGNSGSHKQMRSLASVSLRKSIDSHTPFHFDYFAIDFNEEYSALFGGVLEDQTEFAHLCVKKILGLYKSLPNSPTSVVLIGHSMGGMIAKGIFLEPDFKPSLVRLVVTFATAHSSPVIRSDWYLSRYYDAVEHYWLNHRGDGDREWFETGGKADMRHVTLVSVGGGTRDVLVRSGLVHHPLADVNALTTSIPDVWLSTDHLCSVWCKQLVLVMVRALFDSVSIADTQITSNATEIRRAFTYHLIKRSSGKRLSASAHPPRVTLDPAADWTEDIRRQYTVRHDANTVRQAQHVMVRLVDDERNERLAVEAVFTTPKDWAFACVANSVHGTHRVCSGEAVNLSNESFIAPSARFKRKMLYLNLADLRRKAFTHVILRVQPTSDIVHLNVDSYATLSRRVVAVLPRWLSFTSHVVLATTPERAVHYEVLLPGLEMSYQAYGLVVEATVCGAPVHHASATFMVPWANEGQTVYVTESQKEVLPIKLHTPRPTAYNEADSPLVRLVLDPSCRYTIRIHASMLDSLGQQVRFYATQLPAYVAAILMLTLRYQLNGMEASPTGDSPMFLAALCDGAKPYYVLPAVKMVSKLLGTSMVTQFLAPVLPLPDSVDFTARNLDYFALPFIMFALAFAICYIMGVVLWGAALFSGHTVHKLALRLLSSSLLGSLSWSEWVFAGFSRLPLVVAAMLVFLSYHACGALSLWLAAAFYFLKLCKMYEEYLEDWVKYTLRLLAKGKKAADAHHFSLSSFHCNTTLFLLWIVVALINVPTVLAWAHNYSYDSQLLVDPTYELTVIMCVCAGVLWNGNSPDPKLKYYQFVGHYLIVVAVLLLVFAQTSMHLIGALISAAFVIISVHQTLGSFCSFFQLPAAVDAPAAGEAVEATANEKKDN